MGIAEGWPGVLCYKVCGDFRSILWRQMIDNEVVKSDDFQFQCFRSLQNVQMSRVRIGARRRACISNFQFQTRAKAGPMNYNIVETAAKSETIS